MHSEYRSTYRWHEYTGPRQEVVRKPPIQNGMPAGLGTTNELIEKPIREEDFQTDSGKFNVVPEAKVKFKGICGGSIKLMRFNRNWLKWSG